MTKQLPANFQSDLDYIQSKHESAQAAVCVAVEDAIFAGEALIGLKEKCEHGEFTRLVEAHTTISMRTAQRYMKAARNQLLLDAIKGDDHFEGVGLMELVELTPMKVKAMEFGYEYDAFMSNMDKAVRSIGKAVEAVKAGAEGFDIPINDDSKFAMLCRHAMNNPEQADWEELSTNPLAYAKFCSSAGVS